MSYFSQHTIDQAMWYSTIPNNDFEQTEPDEYFPQAVGNGTLEGVVCNIFTAHVFHYFNNREGIMQRFIMVDKLAKSFRAAIHQYKITSWDVLLENLNVMKNRTYHFSKYNSKPAFFKNMYPGQGVFEIHLMPYSSIVELAPEMNRLVKTCVF